MAKVTRSDVYAAIDSERAYQEAMWQSLDNVQPMNVPKTITLLHAYVRKMEEAWLDEVDGVGKDAPNILRKIAGIAVAGMEECGAPRREGF